MRLGAKTSETEKGLQNECGEPPMVSLPGRRITVRGCLTYEIEFPQNPTQIFWAQAYEFEIG